MSNEPMLSKEIEATSNSPMLSREVKKAREDSNKIYHELCNNLIIDVFEHHGMYLQLWYSNYIFPALIESDINARLIYDESRREYTFNYDPNVDYEKLLRLFKGTIRHYLQDRNYRGLERAISRRRFERRNG